MPKAIMFPGQGSQYKGMGKDLFQLFPKETTTASGILGFDVEDLCVNDPNKLLGLTQFTQPALYVVNAFHYWNTVREQPDYLLGHSLGEYNALLAAEAFDFETGLRLVKKRGELMAAANGGSMAAVIGISADHLKEELSRGKHDQIDVANYNTPSQTVVAGPKEAIDRLVSDFDAKQIRIVPLFVSAPFHSTYMNPAAEEFAEFLKEFRFNPLKIPVISNLTSTSYTNDSLMDCLAGQIKGSVRWTDSIRYLMGKEVNEFQEIGGVILTKMVNEIKEKCEPIFEEVKPQIEPTKTIEETLPTVETQMEENLKEDAVAFKSFDGTKLGSSDFKNQYGVKYAYTSGGMYRGIASKELVVTMAKSGMLSFLGTGGMSIEEIDDNIQFIKNELNPDQNYGMNFLHNLTNPKMEMETIELFMKNDISVIEAAAFMQITEALVFYRVAGLEKVGGKLIEKNNIIAKVSRPEVAELFMKNPPEKLIRQLLEKGLITAEQAQLSKEIPMSNDICVEADSGGHTDGGIAMALFPAMIELRNRTQVEYNFANPIRVGLAGGIGTPQAVLCAFVMGADFITTGSINQCTVEAGTSDVVKDLLQEINVQDTEYAPAGDMFELGAKVQVMKKGVMFPARANKLYNLYQQYNSIEEIPEKIKIQLEKNYFKKTLVEVWNETKEYILSKGEMDLITSSEKNPKEKMSLIFRWYFGYSTRSAFQGEIAEKMNFQIHTGPALGAFNQWVKGTSMESWRNRHVDQIGIKIMDEAASMLQERLKAMLN